MCLQQRRQLKVLKELAEGRSIRDTTAFQVLGHQPSSDLRRLFIKFWHYLQLFFPFPRTWVACRYRELEHYTGDS